MADQTVKQAIDARDALQWHVASAIAAYETAFDVRVESMEFVRDAEHGHVTIVKFDVTI